MASHLRRPASSAGAARRAGRAAGAGLRAGAGARRLASAAAAAALVFGLAGCTGPQPAPPGIQSPTASADASAEWGAYGGKDDACSAVAGDVLTLALVPNNLALADPRSGVDDIDDTIREAADAAPPAIAPNYLQLSAIVEAYGRELAAWSDAVEDAETATPRAMPDPTITSVPTPTPTATATPQTGTTSPTAAGDVPERPAFVGTGYDAQLERIKSWLSDTCG